MLSNSTHGFGNILTERPYILIEDGPLGGVGKEWTGTPNGLILGAVPVEWAKLFESHIITDPDIATIYSYNGQRMMIAAAIERQEESEETLWQKRTLLS